MFSIPLLRARARAAGRRRAAAAQLGAAIGASFARLRHTLRELRRYRHAFLMLLAFLLYNDGIGTIIRMASLYGTQVGIDQGSLIAALLMVQFVGDPVRVPLRRGSPAAIGAKPRSSSRSSSTP